VGGDGSCRPVRDQRQRDRGREHGLLVRLDAEQHINRFVHARGLELNGDSDERRGDPVELAHLGLEQPVMTTTYAAPSVEAIESFSCFGGGCTVLVQGTGPAGSAADAAARIKRRLNDWHRQFSRFEPDSELSLLNRDPRNCVPASAMMTRFAEAAIRAAELTGGLVDPTLVRELEAAGYGDDFSALRSAIPGARYPHGERRTAAPHPDARWRDIHVDRRRGTITRPAGVQLDSGGIAKGLFGDVLASVLGWHESFAVELAGDVRLGGAGRLPRAVEISDPFQAGGVLHHFELADGAVATSGTSKRSWVSSDGGLAHHLLDPATGRPAFTGIVQATAIAPSGVEAEALAKAALLSGPDGARHWLRHGGVLVHEDGSHEVIR
jgi:FAD:protein FMN transferase